MLKKLKIKFVCINMTIITTMLVFILYMVIQFTEQNMEQANIQMMEQLAVNPLYLIKPTDNYNIRLPYFSLRLTHTGEFLEALSSSYDLSDRGFLDNLLAVSHSFPERTGMIPEYGLQFMRIVTPTDQFMIFMDVSNDIATLENLTHTCIGIGVFSFFVFLGISIFFANWAVKPVDKAWTQQKQFIANASHELKTPLTVILTNTELLQAASCDTAAGRMMNGNAAIDNTAVSNTDASSTASCTAASAPSASCTRFIQNIQIMARQMQSLVEGLLELSRIDNGAMKMSMERLNFTSLAESVTCIFEPLYFENNLTLTEELEQDIILKGSDCHLRQVIDILLDNALKYAAPNTEVHVQLQKQRFFALLSVTSHGTPIKPEDLKNIFKRFYRADQSRNERGSYGLGLSIAESIVMEHHGKIWAQSQEDGSTFYVRLPLLFH